MNNRLISSKKELDLFLAEENGKYIKNVTIQFESSKIIDFGQKILNNVTFDSCELSNMRLSNSELLACSFANCTFYKADFTYAQFNCCSFYECSLIDADFYKADLFHVSMRNSNIRGSSFKHATLYDVVWHGADRSFCNFDYSSFELRCANARYKTDMKFVTQVFAHLTTLMVVDETDKFKEVMDYIKSIVAGSTYIGREYLRYTDDELSGLAASCHRLSSKKMVQHDESSEPFSTIVMPKSSINPYNEEDTKEMA